MVAYILKLNAFNFYYGIAKFLILYIVLGE